MALTINGSYAAYVYLVLLQICLVYVQQPGLVKLVRRPTQSELPQSDWVGSYLEFARLLGTAMSLASWLVAMPVGLHWGLASGALFFLLGFGTNVLAVFCVARWRRFEVVGHFVSIPATAGLFYLTLESLGPA